MSATCPCCGGDVSPLDLLIDPATGCVAYRGQVARLTGAEMRMFAALLAAYPQLLSKDQLLAKHAAGVADVPDIKIIDVYVCRLRPKLEPLGLTITTSWSIGYRLELSLAARAAALRARRFAESRKVRRATDRSDIAAIRMLRAQGLPLTGIAQRLKLTFTAVTAVIDTLEGRGDREDARLAPPIVDAERRIAS